MNRENARYGLYALAGFYLLYISYQLYQGLQDADQPILFIGFMIFFGAVGIGLIALSAKKARDGMQSEPEPEEEETE